MFRNAGFSVGACCEYIRRDALQDYGQVGNLRGTNCLHISKVVEHREGPEDAAVKLDPRRSRTGIHGNPNRNKWTVASPVVYNAGRVITLDRDQEHLISGFKCKRLVVVGSVQQL